MKLRFLAILLLPVLFLSSCYTLKNMPDLNFNFTDVVEVPGVSQGKLYLRAVEWFNQNFESSKAVIQAQDKEDGVFYGKSYFTYNGNHKIYFSVNISVKNGKFKYILKDFHHEGVVYTGKRNTPVNIEAGDLSDKLPDNHVLSRKYWTNLRESSYKQARSIEQGLRDAMREQSMSESFK